MDGSIGWSARILTLLLDVLDNWLADKYRTENIYIYFNIVSQENLWTRPTAFDPFSSKGELLTWMFKDVSHLYYLTIFITLLQNNFVGTTG